MNALNSDLFVIGGGINGMAIAADAAGRGLSVVVCEKNDIGSGTSSASSKLIHGGLRYLELYEFGLVKKALHEREVLLNRAPHLITPLEFVLPHEPHLRPAWMIKLGLFFYDHLSKRNKIPASRTLDLKNDIRGKELLTHLKKGFSYFDCYTDDSRLVIANALSAKEHGATILTRTEFIAAEPHQKQWKIYLKNAAQESFVCYAKTLINVAGPWVLDVQKKIKGAEIFGIRLIKGSHFVIPKLYEGDFAYLLQNKDQRIIFAIPFLHDYTLIGTTDVSFKDNLENIHISNEEINYLCQIINSYFQKTIKPEDILWSFAGVRCLQYEDVNPSKITRDYTFKFSTVDEVPLLTVISGKLTTHRLLAEEALQQLKTVFPDLKPAWTAKKPLPGGDFTQGDFEKFKKQFLHDFPWLPISLAERYITQYGTHSYLLLQDKCDLQAMGKDFGHGLYQAEVDYLIKNEWAKTSEDILWRRTKLGMFFLKDETTELDNYLSRVY